MCQINEFSQIGTPVKVQTTTGILEDPSPPSQLRHQGRPPSDFSSHRSVSHANYTKYKLTYEEVDGNAIIVRNFNTPFSTMNSSYREKITMEILDLKYKSY